MWKPVLLVAGLFLLSAGVLTSGALRYGAYSFLLRLAHKEEIDWVRPVARALGSSIGNKPAAIQAALRDMTADRSFELPWLLTLPAASDQESLVNELKLLHESPRVSIRGRANSAYVLALITEDKIWLGRMLEVAGDADTLSQRLAALKVWMLISDSDVQNGALTGLHESDLEKSWIDWVAHEEAGRRLRLVRTRLIGGGQTF